MIRREDLLEAIAKCQGEKNPNANTCIKLSAYYTILNNMDAEPSYSYDEPSREIMYSSGSEFSQVIDGADKYKVMEVIDELMNSIKVIFPKLYDATIDKLKEI